MNNNKEFRDWLLGLILFLLITFTAYSFNKLIFQVNYFSFLEWFALVMMVVILKTGIDTFNTDK